MTTAAKRARKAEPQRKSDTQANGLWINSSRLPTRLAQKGREKQSLEIARLTHGSEPDDIHARYLELAHKALRE